MILPSEIMCVNIIERSTPKGIKLRKGASVK